jgi:beta-lactamase regulating signal transducer with metallopeptidase domain
MSYFWNNLTLPGGFEFLMLLALTTAKATLLLAFAALLCFAFRRLSASTRHLVWATALCASLLLPFLSFIKMWEVPILPARMLALDAPATNELTVNDITPVTPEARRAQHLSQPAEADEAIPKIATLQTHAEFSAERLPSRNTPVAPATPHKDTTSLPTSLWPRLVNMALALWLIGLLLFVLKLLAGFTATTLLTRRADKFADPALTGLFASLLVEVNLKSTVRLLRSERTSMPIVYGILRPAVLLPAEAETWTEERQRMILLHELTHVTRRDCLTQLLAQTACAFYWFNPFIWFAARRLRVEREQACDDYVLSIGTKPSDYANHLLEIARSMQERSIFEWSQTTSVAMARRSQLEGRLLAILSTENKRGAMSRAVAMGLVALICVPLLSLAVVHPTVSHAHNPQTSPHASTGDEDGIDRALPNSFAPVNFGRSVDATIHGAEAREANGKQEDIVSAIGVQQEPALRDGQTGKGSDRGINGDAEHAVAREAADAVAPEAAVSVVQMPEVKPTINLNANPFISAAYRQEQKVETANRSGDYIDELASVGYTNLTVDELIRLKTAGVTADYVRSMRALGFTNLTPKELASLSVHGIAPSYVQAIRAAGYNNLSAKELTTFRIHGITPDYIKTLQDAGYSNLPAKQLTEFMIHGVTPAFISAIRAAGYSNLTPKELVTLRVHGITPDFIRKARSRLGDMTLKQIVSLKLIGVLDEEKDKEKSKEKN